MNDLYVQQVPSGRWLVLQGGQQDRLLDDCPTERAAKCSLAWWLKQKENERGAD